MVMYARADVIRVNYSDKPGSCGQPHERPLVDKNDPDKGYVQVWGVDCPQCEHYFDRLHWSPSVGRIPLTPDQIDEAEEAKQLAAMTMQAQQVALARESMLAAQKLTGDISAVDPTKIAITKSEPAPVAPVTAQSQSTDATYSGLDKLALKDLARERGLPVGGTKDNLIARHVEYDNNG